jgi:hypothetical protein
MNRCPVCGAIDICDSKCDTCGTIIPPCGAEDCEDCNHEHYMEYEDGDTEDDEDEPCGNLYAPGSEECEWCRWSDQCYQDYVYWLNREERRTKVKK